MVLRKGSQLMAGAKVWKESRQGDSGWAASLQSPGLQVALLKKEPPSPHPPTKQVRRVLAARALADVRPRPAGRWQSPVTQKDPHKAPNAHRSLEMQEERTQGWKQPLPVRRSNARRHCGWHTSSFSQAARPAWVAGTIIPTSLMKKQPQRGVSRGRAEPGAKLPGPHSY